MYAWKEYYQKYFEEIKRYFINPPMLTPIHHLNLLYLCVLAIDHALGAVLVQKNDEGK